MRVPRWTWLLALAAFAPMLPFLAPPLAGGDAAYTVLSGSMEPTFQVGDYILVRHLAPGEALQAGDVVTFRQGEVLVTHRVVEVLAQGDERSYVTQGDANAEPDPQPLGEDRVVGKVVGHVPFYGHVARLAAQREGRLLFLVVPAALIMALEVRRLARLGSQRKAKEPVRFEVVRRRSP
jgi:signal peptidase